MTYIRLNGRFFVNYMYVDLNVDENYVADSLFYKRKIPVKFGEEFSADDEKYRCIFCKVRRKYIPAFEEALQELPTKMNLLGYADYEEYCENLLAELCEGLSDERK